MSTNKYNTKQKDSVLKCLEQNAARSLTVDEIVALLKSDGISVGRTTVYRHIEKLLQSAAVRKFTSDKSKSASYQFMEHRDECHGHMHLKCLKCGRLEHLGCEFMSGVCGHIMQHHDFEVDNSKTTIFGLCGSCLESREENNGAD